MAQIINPWHKDCKESDFLRSAKQSVTRKAAGFKRVSRKPELALERFCDRQPNGDFHFLFWQRGGGYDPNISTRAEAIEMLESIHNNPVRRGLCDVSTRWRWSSAGFYAGLGERPIPITPIRC